MTTFPSIAETDRTKLSYILETTFGVTPSGNLIRVRHTGDTLKMTSATKDSEQIRDDQQVQEVMRSSYKASGGLNVELSFASHDDFFLALLHSAAWSSAVTVTSTEISFSASDSSANGTGLFTNITLYSWVKVKGSAANDGYYKVTGKPNNNKIILSGTKTIVDGIAGPSVDIIQGETIVNGVARHSFTFERAYSDLSQEFEIFKGVVVTSGSMSFVAGSMATGSFNVEGADVASATATVGTGYTASNNNPVMNIVDNVMGFICDADGSAIAKYAGKEFTFSVNLNSRAREEMGEGAPTSFGFGDFKPTGTYKGYYNNKKMIDKYINFQDVAMAEVIEDGSGKAYVFDLPRVKLTDGDRSAQSKSNDIMKSVNWSAYAHPTEGVTMRIVRFP